MDETLTPQQHLLLLGRLTPPLMMIIASGLRQIGETRLAEISGQHMATCRKQLRQLADMGYLERRYRYNGYALLPAAYQAIPVIPPDREFSAGSSWEREYAALKPIEGENPTVPSPERRNLSSPIPAPDRENRVLCLPTPDRGFPAGSSQERENAANQTQTRGDSAGFSVVVVGIPSLINKRIPTTKPDPPPDSGGSANAQIAGPTCHGKNRDWYRICSYKPP